MAEIRRLLNTATHSHSFPKPPGGGHWSGWRQQCNPYLEHLNQLWLTWVAEAKCHTVYLHIYKTIFLLSLRFLYSGPLLWHLMFLENAGLLEFNSQNRRRCKNHGSTWTESLKKWWLHETILSNFYRLVLKTAFFQKHFWNLGDKDASLYISAPNKAIVKDS